METKHTVAPWHAVNYGGYIELQKEPYQTEAGSLLDEADCKEAIDNGILCAAAPELLVALQELVTAHREDNTKMYGILLEQAEAAINKATNPTQ